MVSTPDNGPSVADRPVDHSAPHTVMGRLSEIDQDLASRANVKVEDHGYETACWIWQRHVSKHTGYGQAWNGKRVVYAHRHVYEQHVGPIPEGLDIDHLCRVRACVNPEHLEPVTRRENARRGGRSRLTLEQIDEIMASTESYRALARRFGVGASTIAYYKGGAYTARLEAA